MRDADQLVEALVLFVVVVITERGAIEEARTTGFGIVEGHASPE